MAEIDKGQIFEPPKSRGRPDSGLEMIETSPSALNPVPKSTPSTVEAQARLIDRLSLIPKLSEPKTYNKTVKWYITVLVSAAAAIDTLSTNIFYRLFIPCTHLKINANFFGPSCPSPTSW